MCYRTVVLAESEVDIKDASDTVHAAASSEARSAVRPQAQSTQTVSSTTPRPAAKESGIVHQQSDL